MKSKSDDMVDAKKLMDHYRARGFCISHRQLREWIRLSIIHPEEWDSKKRKGFSPNEVLWAGVAFALRTAGMGLDSIRGIRSAIDPQQPVKMGGAGQNKREQFTKLTLLLRNQRETIQSLEKALNEGTQFEVAVEAHGRRIILDEVTKKGDAVTVTEYKNSTQANRDKELQMKFYQRSVETKLKDKKVKCEVKSIREKRGLSQTQLAKIVGFSQARLSQIENGWTQPDKTEKSIMAGVLKERVGTLFPA